MCVVASEDMWRSFIFCICFSFGVSMGFLLVYRWFLSFSKVRTLLSFKKDIGYYLSERYNKAH